MKPIQIPKAQLEINQVVGSYTGDSNQGPTGQRKEKVMDLMKLNSRQGLAGEFQFTSINEVMSFTPFREEWHYCDGDFVNEIAVFAITPKGELELQQALHIGDASNHVKDVDEEAAPIGEQIANMEVNALRFNRSVHNQNEDFESEEYLPIAPPDWKVIRRRVEDALRKTEDRAILFSFAQRLNIKIG